MPPEFEYLDFPSFHVDVYDIDFSDDEQHQEAQPTHHHHQSQENMSSLTMSKSKTRAMPRPTSNIFTKHFEKVMLHPVIYKPNENIVPNLTNFNKEAVTEF